VSGVCAWSSEEAEKLARQVRSRTPETTQGQIDGFFSQPPFKCYLPEVASVGDTLAI
jgi:hypothetical protein